MEGHVNRFDYAAGARRQKLKTSEKNLSNEMKKELMFRNNTSKFKRNPVIACSYSERKKLSKNFLPSTGDLMDFNVFS